MNIQDIEGFLIIGDVEDQKNEEDIDEEEDDNGDDIEDDEGDEAADPQNSETILNKNESQISNDNIEFKNTEDLKINQPDFKSKEINIQNQHAAAPQM